MSVRFKLTVDEQVRQFVFDRSEISVGCSSFNDLVLDDVDGGADVHGTFEVDEEGILFDSAASGVPTSLLRDETCISTVGGEEATEMRLRVGDTIRFGTERPFDITVMDRTDRAGSETEIHELSDASRLRPGAETSHLLWSVTDAVSRSPDIEHLLRGVAAVIDSVVELYPDALTLWFLQEEGEVQDHVYRLQTPRHAPEEDPQPGEAAVEESIDARLFDGTYRRERSPLVGLGIDRPDVVAALAEGDRYAIDRGGPEQASVFLPLGEESLRGIVQVSFVDLGEDASLERVGLVGALIQPLGRIVLEMVDRALQNLGLSEENRYFRQRERRNYLFKDLICESDQMREVYQVLNDWVDRDAPVLIKGEAGSGKSLLARALHHLGPRTDGMLISLDCRALSDEVLDSELFGCVESELVGAVAPRKGVFELADGGTVFLEEIDHLSSLMQGKLLRMLKEGEVRRIGDSVGRQVRARLIASTHRDLGRLVERGQFRRDLYLLLRDHVLEVPSLRERSEDILPLARVYLRKFADRYDRRCTDFSEPVCQRLQSHSWAGNARELKAVVESAVLKTTDEELVEIEHLTL